MEGDEVADAGFCEGVFTVTLKLHVAVLPEASVAV